MENEKKNKTKGNTILLITAIIWGSGFLAQKIGMSYTGPFTFNGERLILASLLLMPTAFSNAGKSGYFSKEVNKTETVERRKHDLLIAILICGLMLSFGTNLQQTSMTMISSGKCGFITSIYIVLIPLFEIFFGERPSIKVWSCVIVAFTGFALLSLNTQDFGFATGDLLSFLSAFAFAIQMMAVDRFVTKGNAMLLSVGQLFTSGVVSFIIALFVEHPGLAEMSASLAPMLYAAILPTAIGFTLQIIGQQYTDPAPAALILSLEGVFAAIWGALIIHETMTPRELLGCALILMATIAANIPVFNREKL